LSIFIYPTKSIFFIHNFFYRVWPNWTNYLYSCSFVKTYWLHMQIPLFLMILTHYNAAPTDSGLGYNGTILWNEAWADCENHPRQWDRLNIHHLSICCLRFATSSWIEILCKHSCWNSGMLCSCLCWTKVLRWRARALFFHNWWHALWALGIGVRPVAMFHSWEYIIDMLGEKMSE
jgi:hypothetical protein